MPSDVKLQSITYKRKGRTWVCVFRKDTQVLPYKMSIEKGFPKALLRSCSQNVMNIWVILNGAQRSEESRRLNKGDSSLRSE
jgi:hypothetical protein